MNIIIKEATLDDVSIVRELIYELALYEHLEKYCTLTDDKLTELMNENSIYSLIAYTEDNIPIGFLSYYFFKITTFSGKKVLYVEDIFIKSEYRRLGVGKLLFDKIKSIAKSKDCERIEWKCLDWNKPSIEFYKSIGGSIDSNWLLFTIDKSKYL